MKKKAIMILLMLTLTLSLGAFSRGRMSFRSVDIPDENVPKLTAPAAADVISEPDVPLIIDTGTSM